jgi:transcription elongation GreA/GreB family factor
MGFGNRAPHPGSPESLETNGLPPFHMEDKAMEHGVHTGSRVTILREDGRHFRFHLVPPDDANVERGRLSLASPLGQALLGRLPGEEFSYAVPRGTLRVKLLEVDPPARES